MQKKQRILHILALFALLTWVALAFSSLTTETAYNVGYEVGSWIGENW